jgi:hypothetical protein
MSLSYAAIFVQDGACEVVIAEKFEFCEGVMLEKLDV